MLKTKGGAVTSMKEFALLLFCAGVIVAIFSSKIDNVAKHHITVKYAFIVIMVALVLFIGITLYNTLKIVGY